VVEGDVEFAERLMPERYRARAEQVVLFNVDAWNVNCPKHVLVEVDSTKEEVGSDAIEEALPRMVVMRREAMKAPDAWWRKHCRLVRSKRPSSSENW